MKGSARGMVLGIVCWLLTIGWQPCTAEAQWPIFRGNAALTGVASGTLTLPLGLLWEFEAGDEVRGSTVVSADRVFFGDAAGRTYALNASDGQVLWTFETGDVIESSPLVVEDLVVTGAMNGTLYALTPTNGVMKWSYSIGSRIMGSANASKSDDASARIVFGAYDNSLHALTLDGEPLWSFATDGFINGSPAVSKQRAVFGGCDAKLHVVDMESGTERVAVELGSYIAASPAILGERAYVGHYGGQLMCVDLTKGRQLWTYGNEEQGGAFFSSPAVTEAYVVVGCRDRKLHCVNAADGSKAWTFQTSGDVDSSPALCDGKVVFGSRDGRLYVVNLVDGTLLWSYDTGSPIVASPAVVNSKIIVATEAGHIMAFGAKTTASDQPSGGLALRVEPVEAKVQNSTERAYP